MFSSDWCITRRLAGAGGTAWRSQASTIVYIRDPRTRLLVNEYSYVDKYP